MKKWLRTFDLKSQDSYIFRRLSLVSASIDIDTFSAYAVCLVHLEYFVEIFRKSLMTQRNVSYKSYTISKGIYYIHLYIWRRWDLKTCCKRRVKMFKCSENLNNTLWRQLYIYVQCVQFMSNRLKYIENMNRKWITKMSQTEIA